MPTSSERLAVALDMSVTPIVVRINGCGCWNSAVGKPREKIRIEPVEVPIPDKTPAPAPVETPVGVPEKVPA